MRYWKLLVGYAGLWAGSWLGGVPGARAQTAAAALPASARRTLAAAQFEQHTAQLYARAGLGATGLPLPVFREGLVGYYNLRRARPAGRGRRKRHAAPAVTPPVLTLIDFAKPSNQKRLWVIDLAQNRVLFHTLVAHGKNSGDVVPVAFSNLGGSEQSSLGFYRTAAKTYEGKHGTSLKLYGLDPGFNTNAERRAVVVHGADYVCEDFVRKHGHLGRSQGCPALPVAETRAIIRAIKGGSILYLHGPAAAGYHSKWLDESAALAAFAEVEGLGGQGLRN